MPVKGLRCSAAGRVTVVLASHPLTSEAYKATDTRPTEGRRSLAYTLLVWYGTLRFMTKSVGRCLRRYFWSPTQNDLLIDLLMRCSAKTGRIAFEEVTAELINCKCMPILLYGRECFSVAKHDFAVTRFLMKLFRSTNLNVIDESRRFFNFMPPSEKN